MLACANASQLASAQMPGPEAQLAARPLAIVAPFPPHGPVNTLSRILANGPAERSKQPTVIDNRTGASGNIGIEPVK